MDQDLLYDTFALALRVVFIVSGPVLAVAILSGVIAGVFQAATTVREPVISYAAKVLGIAVLCIVFLSTASALIIRLAEQAWG